MRLMSKLSVSLFALALTVGFTSQAMAADKGTIKGTVTGTDGKPAANLEVRVTAPREAGKKPAAAAKSAEGTQAKQLADAPAGRPAPIATAKTDDKGEFTVDVHAGQYTVQAGKRDVGQGRENVTVEAGKTATVNITLKAGRTPKAK